MMNDNIKHLKAMLADFEQVLTASVIEELSRIEGQLISLISAIILFQRMSPAIWIA